MTMAFETVIAPTFRIDPCHSLATRRLLKQQKSAYAGLFYGRYWARTSDPQLVEPAALLRTVSGNSLAFASLQQSSHSPGGSLRACSRPSFPSVVSTG